MKKRLACLLLALCMVAGLVPSMASAADTATKQDKIGAARPATIAEYKGYYYALWKTNGAITRHKPDGTENKVLFSYGNLSDLNNLRTDDYYTAERISDFFMDMIIYQDKIYISVAKNARLSGTEKNQYGAIYTMNLDGTGFAEVLKTTENGRMGANIGIKTRKWCIWNDRIYYADNFSGYSTNMTGGDKKQVSWKEYSDKYNTMGAGVIEYIYGNEAFLELRSKTYTVKGEAKDTSFHLFKVNLDTGVVTKYKTLDFRARVDFVEDGWVYITNGGYEWWRVKTDGSEESEYLGKDILEITAHNGDLYYIEKSSETAYKSAGLGRIQPTLALTAPGDATSLQIAGDYLQVGNAPDHPLTDLGGSKVVFKLAVEDKVNYMESSLINKNKGGVYRPSFKASAPPAGNVEAPTFINDIYFNNKLIKDGWYNIKVLGKYIQIDADGYAELRFNSPTTSYYFETKGHQLYTIKTREGKYLALLGEAKDGTRVAASDTPYTWKVEWPSTFNSFMMFPADNTNVAVNASESKFIDGTDLIVWKAPQGWDFHEGHLIRNYGIELLPLGADGKELPRYSIKMSDWARPALSYIENDLGYDGRNSYGDDYTRPMTREQMAVAIVGTTANGVIIQDPKYLPGVVSETAVPEFTDTTNDSAFRMGFWGITSGVGNNRFDPQGLVTREQMATFLARTMNYYDKTIMSNAGMKHSKGDLSQFKDAKTISSWAKDAVATMVGDGLMAGSNGKIDPTGYCSIEQALILLDRIKAKYNRADVGINGERYQEGISKSWYDDGNFTIESKLGGYLTINGEGKSVINQKQSQVFTRKHQGDHLFTLQAADGQYLAIAGMVEDNKQMTLQKEPYLWSITDYSGVEREFAMLRPLTQDTRYSLNVSGSSKEDGAPIIVYTSKTGTPDKLTNFWVSENEVFLFTRVK